MPGDNSDINQSPPASAGSSKPKPATDATREVNSVYRKGLPFDDTKDFEDARRGLIASLPDPAIIRNDQGGPVWDLKRAAFG
jgi:alkyl sulfatase BDS1-like metallo-beta-lactamase superfamily hydrolase